MCYQHTLRMLSRECFSCISRHSHTHTIIQTGAHTPSSCRESCVLRHYNFYGTKTETHSTKKYMYICWCVPLSSLKLCLCDSILISITWAECERAVWYLWYVRYVYVNCCSFACISRDYTEWQCAQTTGFGFAVFSSNFLSLFWNSYSQYTSVCECSYRFINDVVVSSSSKWSYVNNTNCNIRILVTF